jgi:hypothetical protein
MPIHSLNAIPPYVQVGLSVGVVYRMLRLGGSPIGRNALIDTGANITAISPAVVAALAPQEVGQRESIRPNESPLVLSTYLILLCFAPNLGDADWVVDAHWFTVEAMESKIATPGVDVLIGQDLLAQLALSWDGPRGRLLLMY